MDPTDTEGTVKAEWVDFHHAEVGGVPLERVVLYIHGGNIRPVFFRSNMDFAHGCLRCVLLVFTENSQGINMEDGKVLSSKGTL